MKEQQIHLRVSPEEYNLIRQKMKQIGCVNMSAYIRKMAIDGMIIKLDISELKDISRLLQYSGNNLNQIAKKLNGEKSVYADDIADIKENQAEILKLVREVYLKLCKL